MIVLLQSLPPAGAVVTALCGAIYFVAAVFSGLSGFGFSAIGALTLCLLPAPQAIGLLMSLSLITQTISVGALFDQIRREFSGVRDSALPYAAGGCAGLPLGFKILAVVSAKLLVLGLGTLLLLYSIYNLLKPVCFKVAGGNSAFSALLVGFCGGVVGGFSAFPGSALVVWNGLKGCSKEKGRSITEPFIVIMQVVGLTLFAVFQPELFDPSFFRLLALALPIALWGNWLGIKIYRKTSQVNYRKITLCALGISGLGLLLKVVLS